MDQNEIDKMKMATFHAHDVIKQMIFISARELINKDPDRKMRWIREALAAYCETTFSVDFNNSLSVKMQRLVDYKTPFLNVIPVRVKETWQKIVFQHQMMQEDIKRILSDVPLIDESTNPHFWSFRVGDALHLVLHSIFSIEAIGWDEYDRLWFSLMHGEKKS